MDKRCKDIKEKIFGIILSHLKQFIQYLIFFQLQLLSGSRDGKILIWNALPAKNQLKLIDGYLMLIDYLPRTHAKSLGTEMAGKLINYLQKKNSIE